MSFWRFRLWSPLQVCWFRVSVPKRSDRRRSVLATAWFHRIDGWQMATAGEVSQRLRRWKGLPDNQSHRNNAVNSLRPRQNGRHFAHDIFKCIFLNENIWIPIKISLKFVHKGPINNIPALVQIMAWRRPGDKPLSEAMMVSLLTHICVTRPQWVKLMSPCDKCFNTR